MGHVSGRFSTVKMIFQHFTQCMRAVGPSYHLEGGVCVFKLGSERVCKCFQRLWASLGRPNTKWTNDTSLALLLHKLPAHYSNAVHLAQEEGGEMGGWWCVRTDC